MDGNPTCILEVSTVCPESANFPFTAFIFAASGLMIASRYPILAVDFHVCRHKTSLWQKPICYGIIMAKVELEATTAKRKVGFLANLHNVAYQGDEDLIGPFLTEAQSHFNEFQSQTLQSSETCAFSVICGDFNFDNISPGMTIFFFKELNFFNSIGELQVICLCNAIRFSINFPTIVLTIPAKIRIGR